MTFLYNNFKLARRIAIGDIAEVMLAAQHGFGGLEKLVVIKAILPHVRADEHFVRIFVGEARRAAAIRHQHVAEIYEVHHDEYDLCVVMEYVSGEDVAHITQAQRKGEFTLPVPIACRIISQAAEGLHYAHKATDADGAALEVMHHDVSPGNVIVTYSGVTKLTDFGIARADEQDVHARPETVKAKLPYRAPERIRRQEVDERSDVYSLGILLYQLLGGRPPFQGENEASIIQQVMELSVPAPSELNANVSPELDALVLKAIEREPNDRFSSALELRQALDDVLARARTFVSQHEINIFMTSALKARLGERRRMERAVIAEARHASRLEAMSVDVPPMFGGMGGTEVTVTPSATSLSGMGGTQGQYWDAGTQAVRARSRTLVLGLIAAFVMLLVVVVFAAAFWLGRQPQSTNASGLNAEFPATEQPDTTSAHSFPVSLFVHVKPAGAAVLLDGHVVSQDVGSEGVLVPVAPDSVVMVGARKAGFITLQKSVRVPRSGTRHIYLNLTSVEMDASIGRPDSASADSTTEGAVPTGPSRSPPQAP